MQGGQPEGLSHKEQQNEPFSVQTQMGYLETQMQQA